MERQGSATTAIFNAFAILEQLSAGDGPQTLTQLGRRLDIPKASAFRNLNALEQCGYVARRDGGYVLGPRVLGLARRFSEKDEIIAAARPHLVELAASTSETAHLAVLSGSDIIYLDVVQGSHLVRAVVHPGDRIPAHCVASGKVIMAFGDDAQLNALLEARPTKFTARTLVAEAALRRDFEVIRARGYATNVGEWVDDVAAVSSPIIGSGGKAAAAMGIAGPRSRLGPKVLEKLSVEIRRQAGLVSEAIAALRGGAGGSSRAA